MTHDDTRLTPGERVQLHPATDLWMRGCRFGTVVLAGRKWVRISLDKGGREVAVLPGDLIPLGEVEEPLRALCPQCAGVSVPLGALGTREHFRCRACGWTFSTCN